MGAQSNLGKNQPNKFQLPATLRPYDGLYPIFNVLFGEEHKRFFNPIVRVVNETAITEKEERNKEIIVQALFQYLMQGVEQDNNPQPPPEEVLKAAQMSAKDMREVTAEKFLSFYKKKFRLKDVFATGWKDWLIAGEEFYRVEAVAGEVSVKRVNPLQLFFKIGENNDSIEECDQILEENYLTVNQIIDEFYEDLHAGGEATRACGLRVKQLLDEARWTGIVRIYGDPAGRAAKTTGPSDHAVLRGIFGPAAQWCIRPAAPHVRDRVAAVNGRLETLDGRHHLTVDPTCVGLIADLEQVVFAKNGDIDKDSNPELSHQSDALGYFVEREFPARGGLRFGAMRLEV